MNAKMIINEFIDYMSNELRHGECYFPLLAWETDYLPRFFSQMEAEGKIDQEDALVPKDEYEELLERDAFLSKLEAAGVDAWEGFEVAQEMEDE